MVFHGMLGVRILAIYGWLVPRWNLEVTVALGIVGYMQETKTAGGWKMECNMSGLEEVVRHIPAHEWVVDVVLANLAEN
jgi:hypothetical protein